MTECVEEQFYNTECNHNAHSLLEQKFWSTPRIMIKSIATYFKYVSVQNYVTIL